MKRPAISFALLGALCSCGSVQTKTFEFRAIDVEEREVQCLIEFQAVAEASEDQRFALAELNRKQYTTGIRWRRLEVPISDDGVRVRLLPVEHAPDGRNLPIRHATGDVTVPTQRRLLIGDPPSQLFVVERPPEQRPAESWADQLGSSSN